MTLGGDPQAPEVLALRSQALYLCGGWRGGGVCVHQQACRAWHGMPWGWQAWYGMSWHVMARLARHGRWHGGLPWNAMALGMNGM